MRLIISKPLDGLGTYTVNFLNIQTPKEFVVSL